MRTTWFLVVLALMLPFSVSLGTVIRVPSEAPSIGDAIDASSDGDTVLVAPGIYTGLMNTALYFAGTSVSLLSEDGADVTAIDGGGVRPGLIVGDGANVVLEGFTVQDVYAFAGSALRIAQGSTVAVRNCRFLNCRASNGAVVDCTSEAAAAFEDCLFQDNSATVKGGVAFNHVASLTFSRCDFVRNTAPDGGVIRSDARPNYEPTCTTMSDCTFIENSAQQGSVFYTYLGGVSLGASRCVFSRNTSTTWYGVLVLSWGTVDLDECLFENNTGGVGSIVQADGPWSSISNSTFVENSVAGGVLNVDYATVSNVVIAFATIASAVCAGATPALSCCSIYGNAGGDWIGPIASQLGVDGNICEDPLFCGGAVPESPYSLHENSPCAAANSGGCGTIGLFDEGCGVSATETLTWGGIKVLYR